jgi:hypothetical protein
VVKHVYAVEVRIAVATVLAAAADAVLVAHHLSKLGSHLVTARPFEETFVRQEARGRKKAWGGGGGRGDAGAGGDRRFGSCAAGKMKYTALCVQWHVNPCGDVSSASWDQRP